MPDHLLSFRVERSASEDFASINRTWPDLPPDQTTLTDDAPPEFADSFYRVQGTTASGLIIPSSVAWITTKPPGSVRWVKGFGSTGVDSAAAVVVDAAGNLLIAGKFQGSVDFGGGVLASVGGMDMFLTKYSSAGVHLWSKRFGGAGSEVARCIALDSSGNIFIGGGFYGTANFGGTDIASNGDQDAFLAKYTPQGDYLWSITLGTVNTERINSLAVDSQGNVVVTGVFRSSWTPMVVVGTDGNGTSLDSLGIVQPFLAKFSAAGAFIFAQNFLCNGGEGTAVAVDKRMNPNTGLPHDNILFAGYAAGFITIGGTDFPPGGFLAEFSPSGDYIPVGSIGVRTCRGSNTRIFAMKIDSNGDVVTSGTFNSQADLGNGTIYGTSYYGDMFVAKYSLSDFSWKWQTLVLGTGDVVPNSLAIDAQNNIFMAGMFYGPEHFGSQTLTTIQGITDGFAAKFSGAGIPVWAQSFGATTSADGNSVAVDVSGNPIIAGEFSGNVSLGSQSLTSAGGTDALLMKLNP